MLVRARAIDNILLAGKAHRRDIYHKTIHRGCGVATHDIYAQLLGSRLHTLIKGVECLYRNLRRHAERHYQLLGLTVHRKDIVYTTHNGLIAQVLKREVAQVEVDALGEHICC